MTDHRVRGSSHTASQPAVSHETGLPRSVDPNTLVTETQSRFGLNEPGLNKMSATPPVVDSRFAERGDVVGQRLIAQVLVCALGVAMSQIDEPGAPEAGSPTPSRRS